MKHTKGPWKLHDSKQVIAWDSLAQESSTICFIGSCDTSEEEDLANAALISAAPDMLDVIFDAYDLIKNELGYGEVTDKLEAVIKKAKGE